jgi:HD superfamily phosphohydrolase YqeK
MREKLENSMDDAMKYALRYTINDLVSRNKPLHLDTVKAYNQVALKGEN